MKHLILLLLGCMLSFALVVLCNPYSGWLLPVGTYMGDLRATIAANKVYNIFSLSITPLALLIYTVIVGSACRTERNAQQLRYVLITGIVAGGIFITYYFFHALGSLMLKTSGEAGVANLFAVVVNLFVGSISFFVIPLFIVWCILPVIVGLPFNRKLVREQVVWISALGIIYFVMLVISAVVTSS